MGLPVDMGGDDLYVNNIYTGNTGPGQSIKGGVENIANVLTASTTLTNAQSGGVFVLSALAGLTVTLPTPVVGTQYTFVIGTVNTSNAYKILSPAGVYIDGGIYFDKALTITRYDGNSTSFISLNFNGTTTGGGAIGDTISLIAVSATQWAVSGTTVASSTLATPFATS